MSSFMRVLWGFNREISREIPSTGKLWSKFHSHIWQHHGQFAGVGAFKLIPKAPGGWIYDVLDDWCWIFSFRLQVSIGIAWCSLKHIIPWPLLHGHLEPITGDGPRSGPPRSAKTGPVPHFAKSCQVAMTWKHIADENTRATGLYHFVFGSWYMAPIWLRRNYSQSWTAHFFRWLLGLGVVILRFLMILYHPHARGCIFYCFNRHLVAEINHCPSKIRKCSWLSVGWSTDIASKIFTVPYWFKPHHLLAKPHLLKTKYLTIEWN